MKSLKKTGALAGATILTMAMLTGCAQTEEIVDNSAEQSVITEESTVESEDSNIPEELYTVDKDGVYTFNTDLFDPEKFSGTIHIHNREVSLPLTHENLNAANIYVGSQEWFEDGEDYETHLAETIVEAGDDEKYYGLYYKVEGSAAEKVEGYGSMYLYNFGIEDIPMSECQIDRYDTSLNGNSSQNKAAWTIFYGEEEGTKRSENGFDVDAVMEVLGAPAVSNGNDLIYPYEDYVIVVTRYYAENCDLVWICSWDYFLEEAYSHNVWKPFDEISEEYRYGHY